MKILPHFVHRVAAFGILGAVLSFAYISNSDLFKAPRVESASTVVGVSGYAWMNTPQSAGAPDTGTDQGLGWMSFKGVAGDGSSYGVKLDLDTGYFSGYAWIGNGDDGAGSTGWVYFSPTSGYPETPNHGVRKETDGTLTGWAQVITMYNENPDNGWIKMSGTATDGSPYGVTVGADGRFSGKAWGSDVIGWVDFAPSIAVENGEEPHIETVACTPGDVVPSSWTECAESSDFCSSNPAGVQITGTQMGTCGAGYSGTAVRPCDVTGKTCGSTGCTTDTDCGGGETCLLGTKKCGSATTGCGNGTCNVGESLLTCPQDCKGTIKQI